MAPLDIKNERENIPRAEHGNASPEFIAPVQPFENRNIGVGFLVVAVDARIGNSGENLVVTGIGKFLGICDGDSAAFALIAQKLSVFGNLAPEKRQQHFTARFRRVAPEFFAQRIRVGHAAVFFREQLLFRAGKKFLSAKSIRDDQKNVFRFVRRSLQKRGIRKEKNQADEFK